MGLRMNQIKFVVFLFAFTSVVVAIEMRAIIAKWIILGGHSTPPSRMASIDIVGNGIQ